MNNEKTAIAADILNFKPGKTTIAENLQAAQLRGDIILHEDGSWSLTRTYLAANNWVFGPVNTPFPCGKLMGFLFYQAYARATVPDGCRTCYKVQVRPATLQQLVASERIAHDLPYAYKAGASLNLQFQAGPYRTLFYLDSLQQAQDAYKQVRERVNLAKELGPNVEVTIKRGCTAYEIHCGPSNNFTFSNELKTVETALLERLRPTQRLAPVSAAVTLMKWVQIAYQVGDNSYKNFTQGRPLYKDPVNYSPE